MDKDKIYVIEFSNNTEFDVVTSLEIKGEIVEADCLASSRNFNVTEKAFFSLTVWQKAKIIPVKNLPIYLNAKYITPKFEELLKGG